MSCGRTGEAKSIRFLFVLSARFWCVFPFCCCPREESSVFSTCKGGPHGRSFRNLLESPAVRYSGGNEFSRIGKHCDCSALVVRSAPRRGSCRHGRGSRDRLDGVHGSASA